MSKEILEVVVEIDKIIEAVNAIPARFDMEKYPSAAPALKNAFAAMDTLKHSFSSLVKRPRVYDQPIPVYGDVMTIDSFYESLKSNFITMFDGFGYWVKDDKMDRNAEVFETKQEDATHVVWLNK